MPFQYGDLIVAGVMLVSGLLALMRGFTREVLSLIAWGLAAIAVLFALQSPELLQLAGQYIENKTLAMIVVGTIVFLIVLIIMSIISVKIADLVLDSAAGPFDRTLGFIYGLARGLLLVVVVYLFYIYFIPREKHWDSVRQARSLPVVERISQFVISFLPSDVAETLQDKTYTGGSANPPATDENKPKDTSNDQEEEGYKPSETRPIDDLIKRNQQTNQN